MEIVTVSKDEGGESDTMSKLYEASMEGSVITLKSLMEKDKLILSKISLTTFSETPLHISALLGHTAFTETLLGLQPSLAWVVDARSRRSPLHLASANGHVDTVRALLRARDQFVDRHGDMCLAKDGDGKIALHYAAMRGRAAVAELLVAAQPRSVLETVREGGETVLHLCVEYNQLEMLKLLLSLSVNSPYSAEFLVNYRDSSHGNTVLHLAVMLKQIETVKYLLSVPGVKQDSTNHKGLKASELLEQHPQTDFTTLKLKLIMKNQNQDDDDGDGDGSRTKPISSGGASFVLRHLYSMHKAAGQWLHDDQTRASIMVVAALITQTTFQTAFNPPGGVWQETTVSDPYNLTSCNVSAPCIAGTSVLARTWEGDYVAFVIYNTVSFFASLTVILVVMGGLPLLTNRLCTWLMTIAMLVALTFVALTYIKGMEMVAPDEVHGLIYYMAYAVALLWLVLLLVLWVFHTAFVLVWMHKKSLLLSRYLLRLR